MEIFPQLLLVMLFLPAFLIAVGGGYIILWRPLLDWMNERDRAIHGSKAEADALDVAVAEAMAKVDVQLGSVRSELGDARQAARAEASAAEQALVGDAQAKAEARIDEATAQIASEAAAAREGLAEASRTIANEMATQVLGRQVEA